MTLINREVYDNAKALRARKAMHAYAKAHGRWSDEYDTDEMLPQLLEDLLHLCVKEEIDFVDEYEKAREAFELFQEVDPPEDDEG